MSLSSDLIPAPATAEATTVVPTTVDTTRIVDEVRALLRVADRPLTARERCLLVALVARAGDPAEADVVDLLETATRAVRYRIRQTGRAAAPELIALLAAVDAFLGHPEASLDPSAAIEPDAPPVRDYERGRYRLDTDTGDPVD